ncbi:hypothetical protein GUJ93_ZPchr0014g47468 [Zizania palustris]|uniref:Uncharacterized protein n=1 Tax=Zizania palustris TaxID=103762 RepID=A0A8J5TBE1_ZIZPA|nr:hypothetical protein GUJ93_ZPchr0014g47468 [Zizania palustris]
MRLPAILRLVALVVLLAFFSSSLQRQAAGVIRLHDRRRHGEQWEEERTQMRSFMTMDYSRVQRKRPIHN